MKRISFIVLLLVILGQSGLHACTCSSSTYKFVSDLNKYDFVGLVEIIGRDTIINYELDRTFTVVKIIKQYKGMVQNDTIKVLESGGADCYDCLQFQNKGGKYIIKASLDQKSNWEGNLIDFVQKNEEQKIENILTMFICEVNTLTVEGDSIFGNITRRENIKKTSLDSGKEIFKIGYTRKLKTFGYYIERQKMSLPKVEKIIKRRLKRD